MQSPGHPAPQTNRDRALDAAVRVVGGSGIHALSHARVDSEADLPRGSTSNHFRTRAALLQGTANHLAAIDQQAFAQAPSPRNLDELVEAIVAFTRRSLGPDRLITAARMAFFVEGAHDAEVRSAIAEGRRRIEEWAGGVLVASGLPESVATVRRALAVCDGVILHALALGLEDELVELGPLIHAALAEGIA